MLEKAPNRRALIMATALAIGQFLTACSGHGSAQQTTVERPVTSVTEYTPPTTEPAPAATPEERAGTGVSCVELATNPNDAGARMMHRWHAVDALSPTPEYNKEDLVQAIGANALAEEAKDCGLPEVAALYVEDTLQLSDGIPGDKLGDAVNCVTAESQVEAEYCLDSLKN